MKADRKKHAALRKFTTEHSAPYTLSGKHKGQLKPTMPTMLCLKKDTTALFASVDDFIAELKALRRVKA